jgi:hypothetical protein
VLIKIIENIFRIWHRTNQLTFVMLFHAKWSIRKSIPTI